MANERDNAFTSTGVGGMDQGTDFDPTSGGTNRSMDSDTGHGEPVTARARDAVSTAGHKAVERVQERIADQVTRATGQLESVASSLRQAGEQMPPDNGIGRYMVQAATQVDNLASFLGNREIGELVDEVEDFARRQPAVFIGGAFALGILGARFLRSSRQNLGIDNGSGHRRGYFEDGYGDSRGSSESATSYGRTGNVSQSNFETGYSGSTQPGSGLSSTGYSAGSTQAGTGASSGGYNAGSSRMGSGNASTTPGGTTGTNAGLAGSTGLGSTSTSRDLASDTPSGSRDFGTSTGGLTGSGTSRTGSFGSGTSSPGSDLSTRSRAGDDETRTTGLQSDSLSSRSGTGSDRESLERETDKRSPDFL